MAQEQPGKIDWNSKERHTTTKCIINGGGSCKFMGLVFKKTFENLSKLKLIDKAIEEQNEDVLRRCIIDLFNQTKEISMDYYPRIEKILVDKWHQEHEDIVEMIWLKDLKDNRFVNPILTIAEQREIYRSFDDELESTLRKCVHALKAIGTEESNIAVERLVSSGNENVKYALENYK